MGELVQQNQQSMMTALVPRSIPEAVQLAETLAKANLVPEHLRGKPGDCLLVVMQAQRWGMDALSVAQCTSVVRGKLCYEGKLVSAALLSMGAIQDELDFEYSGSGLHRKIVVTGTLRSGKSRSIEGTVEQWATDNGNWKKSPDDMLAYRGSRQWARRWAPAAMLGVYTPDEFDDGPAAATATVTVVPRGDSLPAYSEADFNANLPRWKDVIARGIKSADEIIAMVETKGTLTDAQRAAIRPVPTREPEIVEGEFQQTEQAA